MRMMEVGTKSLTKGDMQDAQGFFDKSYQLYSLFWGLNLGMVNGKQVRKVAAAEIDSEEKKQASIFNKLGALVKQAVDCCKE